MENVTPALNSESFNKTDDYRQKCFSPKDILKLVLLISKMDGELITPHLEQLGFDGLWNLHFGEYTLSGLFGGREDGKETVSIMISKSEVKCSASNCDCPVVDFASYDLLMYAKKHNIYYAELLEKYGRPHESIDKSLAVSYSWKRNLSDVLVHCLFANNEDQHIWLDIVNVNQNSRNITAELEIIPTVYSTAKNHIMISRSDLQRGWCYFEYALRTHAIQEQMKTVDSWNVPVTYFPEMGTDLTDFWFLQHVQGGRNIAKFAREESFRYSRTQFTVEDDRGFVVEEIKKLFGSVENAENLVKEAFSILESAGGPQTPRRTAKPTAETIERVKRLQEEHKIEIPQELMDELIFNKV